MLKSSPNFGSNGKRLVHLVGKITFGKKKCQLSRFDYFEHAKKKFNCVKL
jgi:hypothetical protein